ncbi:PREDICTED: probable serine/threonine-protein kinase cdc7 [Ceratosolen solmsi marchali]|uniref:Probable serine/threonine-protein kinase cdc7 n=1 Tax=Ceratosolen solmsi marchali TaxID=326594 RepID=A0AAJ6YUS3_9HYME|nr:PREDICTED: probable serine/threonine-protein kinase cdc7 [Ceratosolen solmsi marchali]
MAAKARRNACLVGVLLLLGIQLATCKSVDETFKDDHYNARVLSLSKREVEEESSDEQTTTLSAEDNSEWENDDETTPIPTTSTPKPYKKRRPMIKRKITTTTTESSEEEPITASTVEEENDSSGSNNNNNNNNNNDDDNDEQEERMTPSVKPLLANKSKSKKKVKPTAVAATPTIGDRIKPEGEAPSTIDSNIPKQPSSNLLPPMPHNYFPQNYNGFLTPAQSPAFAPWGFGPIYAPAPMAYDYPHPTGPAFSDAKVEEGSSVTLGNGFASASASAGGAGGAVSTSTSPGNGYNRASNSFGTHGGSIPAGGSHQNTGSFVSIRGSFPASDGESVGIEVNGPAATGRTMLHQSRGKYSSALKAHSLSYFLGGQSYQPNYSASVPVYAGAPPYGSNPYGNSLPNYAGYANPVDFQSFFQQYFAALQAQQQAFQQQLQAQIDAQRQAGGGGGDGFVSSGAYITNDEGKIDPKAQVYVNTYTSSNHVPSTSVNSRSGSGGSRSSVSTLPYASNKNLNRIWEQSNQVDSNFGAYGGSPSNGPQGAFATASIGPNGGFQAAHISPASPGIFSRFAEDIPPPGGKQYGVFSSSSSSSSTGPDGKQIAHKSATIGINDNGKVTYKTVHDP